MKTLEIKIPDNFTDEQVTFIKESAISQIEAEMKSELKIPQAEIDAVDAQVAELKTAMDIEDPIKEEPINPIEEITP